MTIAESFDDNWKRNRNGCWIWQRACKGKEAASGGGYGCFRLNGRTAAAHVFAWERDRQRKVPRGRHVMHTCHNTKCVNPAHLTVGTNTQNAAMKAAALRASSKLKPADIRAIRRRTAAGEFQRVVAADYDLHQADVSNIVNRKYWRHVA